MKIDLNGLYRYLISHTFPGFLIIIEMGVAYEWINKHSFHCELNKLISIKVTDALVIIIIVYALSTMIGIIIDGIRHLIMEDIQNKKEIENKFIAIDSQLKKEIYVHFIEEDFWYPYEALANTGIAMIPGILIVGLWLLNRGFPIYIIVIVLIVYAAILSMTFREAKYIYHYFCKHEDDFIKTYKEKMTNC